MLKEVIVCEECKKEQLKEEYGRTVRGWFRIERISMNFRPKDLLKGDIPDANKIYHDSSRDPDFCSEKCIISWFKKQLKKIKEGKTE